MKSLTKNLLSILLILSVLVCLAACGGSKIPSGEYSLVSIEISEGNVLNAEALKSMGMTGTIVFHRDGTGVMKLGGDPMEFQWQGNKMTTSDGEQTFEFGDDTVKIRALEGLLVFRK
ncbi:MAG: hypothetical protein ACI3V2_01400 [Faecousia sp.]